MAGMTNEESRIPLGGLPFFCLASKEVCHGWVNNGLEINTSSLYLRFCTYVSSVFDYENDYEATSFSSLPLFPFM